MVARSVGSPFPTKLPTGTAFAPMRPANGALTSQYPRSSSADFTLRLSGRHLGLVRFLRGHGGVEILLGNGLLRHERREPGNFQTAPGQRGLGLRQHSLRSRELLFVRLLIEFK